MFRSYWCSWCSCLPLSNRYTSKAYTFFAGGAIAHSRRVLTILTYPANTCAQTGNSTCAGKFKITCPIVEPLSRKIAVAPNAALYSLCFVSLLGGGAGLAGYAGPANVGTVRRHRLGTGFPWSTHVTDFPRPNVGSLPRITLTERKGLAYETG